PASASRPRLSRNPASTRAVMMRPPRWIGRCAALSARRGRAATARLTRPRAGGEDDAMILTIFPSRLRPEHAREDAGVPDRIHELGTRMRGFVSIKTFTADDGERVSIVAFESWETHDAWRGHPEHVEAQRLGREKFYSEFSIEVCEVVRESRF